MQGEPGPQGVQGQPGQSGSDGNRGKRGRPGDKGVQGNRGPQGPRVRACFIVYRKFPMCYILVHCHGFSKTIVRIKLGWLSLKNFKVQAAIPH